MPTDHTAIQNALIDESSPYLLQHANNPVSWLAWNAESLTLAKNSNKELKIYDMKNFWHSVRAYYKGIEETPVIIIGNKQFSKDDINLEQPIELSKETFESTMDQDRFRNGLLLMAIGGAFGLLALILLSSGFFCFSAMISVTFIGVGVLVSFGHILDQFYDWAN